MSSAVLKHSNSRHASLPLLMPFICALGSKWVSEAYLKKVLPANGTFHPTFVVAQNCACLTMSSQRYFRVWSSTVPFSSKIQNSDINFSGFGRNDRFSPLSAFEQVKLTCMRRRANILT